MAKKGSRIKISLVCQSCKRRNYITEKNKLKTTQVIKLKKYCPHCRRHTLHKETKKL